ncbi:MAG TPA: hydantoinase/oxoprolinase family protein [Methanomassiliicoccales archaeon]|nr:hydantoinase/oxoprolinase family protein [Methanomassiliicoccales archaeon]
MELGLGIDTGGTYTDAAMVDLSTKRLIAWSKSPTTPQDLTVGIESSVRSLLKKGRFDPIHIKLVGLSTTLATNSVLESRGGRVGLVGIGWDTKDVSSLGAEHCAFIKGGHDSKGRELDSLDLNKLREVAMSMADEVDAFVVSSMFSVYQPSHEDRARHLIREATERPVVAAYELSGELGVVERSVTAVLNARLLPVISDFLDRIESSMKAMRIAANIVVLKGDGNVMPVKLARERPVETILSGPAASLLGGSRLSGLDNCLVVDMGGTSTDIAYIDNGFPRIGREGAQLAGWRTRVRSIDATTVGLGGDSEIGSDMHGDLRIGPTRVLPLAFAGERTKDLPRMIMERRRTDFYVTARGPERLSGNKLQIYRKVEELGLCDEEELRSALPDLYLVREMARELVHSGHLLRTGLTPTDIFNLEGLYVIGDEASSRAGVEHYLEGTRMSVEAYCARVMHRMVGRLAEEIVRKVVAEEIGDLPKDPTVDRLVQLMAGERSPGSFRIDVRLDRPIVGIGGPSRLLMPSLRELLGAEVVIPEGGPVGNAVGAVCSRISETLTLRIQPLSDGEFQLVTPWGDAQDFRRSEDAIKRARDLAEEHVRGKADRAGAIDMTVRSDVREVRFKDQKGMDHLNWIEVTARATGEPRQGHH